MAYLPNNDDRYFLGGLDNSLMQLVQQYDDEQYRHEYPLIQQRLANMFSINLQEAIVEFRTTVSPMLAIAVEDVIDLACYYYGDLDCVVSVVDEFVDNKKIDEIQKQLTLLEYDAQAAEHLLEAQLALLADALRPLIDLVVGLLARLSVPAITNYGSCYRLSNLDSNHTAYFTIRHPDNVYGELYCTDFDKATSFISF